MLPHHVVVAGSSGRASHLATREFSDMGGPVGISNMGQYGGLGIGWEFVFPIPFPLSTRPVSTQNALFTRYLRVIYALFSLNFIVFYRDFIDFI